MHLLNSLSVNKLLYIDRALNSWGDRCWEFAIGLYLIKLNPDSLILAAIQGIFASCLSIVINPYLGKWISKAHRLQEIGLFLFLQNLFVFIASSFVALFFLDSDYLGFSFHRIVVKLAPLILVIFSALAQVASSGYTLSLEKDWILVIAKDEEKLSALNASLRRIDLIIKTISPLLIGAIIEYSDLISALFLMSYNIFSGLIEYMIMRIIYNKVNELSNTESKIIKSNDSTSNTKLTGYMESIMNYMKYFGSPGIAFSLLYLSVLGFDSITVGFVKSKGVSETMIGLVSVLGALTGIIGTIIFQLMVKRIGLNKTSTIGYLSDLIPLSLCLITFLPSSLRHTFRLFDDKNLTIILFLTGITLSRVGLWITDLSSNQLIQTTTSNPALIGGVQNSMNTSAELTKFILTAILPNLNQFYILVIVSYCSIGIGTLLSIIHTCIVLNLSKKKNNNQENINLSVIET